MLSPPDPKQEMIDKGAVYYANKAEALEYDDPLVCIGLAKTVLKYVKDMKVVPVDPFFWRSFFVSDDKNEDRLGGLSIYYNNFEVTDLEFFLQPTVVSLAEYMVDSKGIYRYRWGDAVLRYMTLAVFARPDQYLVRKFDYIHPCY